MSLMATLGLVFMLLTQESRRANDASKPPTYEVLHVPLLGRLFLSAYLAGLAYFIVRGSFTADSTQDKLRPWRLGLGGALIVLALVLPFMLRTRPAPQAPEINPVRSVPPAQLEGLAYIPADVDAIAGIHVAEAMQTEAGRAVIGKLKIPKSDLSIDALADWLGVHTNEIDHIVIAVRQVQVFIVIRTRKEYDQERVTSDDFGVSQHPRSSEKLPLYQREFGFFKPTFYCADKRTLLLFSFLPPNPSDVIGDLKNAAEKRLDSPVRHLDRTLRDLFQEQDAVEARLWLIGRASALKTPFVAMLGLVDDDSAFTKIEDVAIWSTFRGADIQLQTVIDATDDKAAAAIEEKLTGQARANEVSRDRRRVTWLRTTNAEKLLGKLPSVK
jgi:hypothetical protein